MKMGRRGIGWALIVVFVAIGIALFDDDTDVVERPAPAEATRSFREADSRARKSGNQTPELRASTPAVEFEIDGSTQDELAALAEAVRAIEAGGPFRYRKDGTTFSNREERLPRRPPGYYKEYTVKTADSPDRGARRIVRGEEGEMYYTRDHYQSFVLMRRRS